MGRIENNSRPCTLNNGDIVFGKLYNNGPRRASEPCIKGHSGILCATIHVAAFQDPGPWSLRRTWNSHLMRNNYVQRHTDLGP